MSEIDIRLQYHSPDRAWAAVLVRWGMEWHLDGALVGMSSTPTQAVADLLALAQYLVIHGENALTQGPISLADRIWLFKLLDVPGEMNEEMYAAIRAANRGVDPYQATLHEEHGG